MNYHKYILQFGFDLSLCREGAVFNYVWRDPITNKVVAEGWSRGTKREGEQEAVNDIRRITLAAIAAKHRLEIERAEKALRSLGQDFETVACSLSYLADVFHGFTCPIVRHLRETIGVECDKADCDGVVIGVYPNKTRIDWTPATRNFAYQFDKGFRWGR